jgi:DNA replication and repair protein RecF
LNIEKLQIKNLRLFKDITLTPTKQFNIITGSNGSGKTTILESIYLLARSKSFRTNNSESLISYGHTELLISANFKCQKCNTKHIGIRKTKNITEVHINSIRQKKLSEQAKQMPLGIITPNAQKLLTDGPITRRRFLNWGVFHVEHNYASLVSKYNKVLMHRNSALKNDYRNSKIWDDQLVSYGNNIDRIRNKYVTELTKLFNIFKEDFPEYKDIKIKYKRGWNNQQSLIDAIKNDPVNKNSVTYFGPHRADLTIYLGDKIASDIISNGQQKIISILLIISQLYLINNFISITPILLIDDFQYEIDDINLQKIINIIKRLNIQTFITSVIGNQNNYMRWDSRMFHVEHGEIR